MEFLQHFFLFQFLIVILGILGLTIILIWLYVVDKSGNKIIIILEKGCKMKKLFWLDLETTGLNESTNVVLEVGVKVTDKNFKVLDAASWVIYTVPEELDKMNPWCQNHHTDSGLVNEVSKSNVSRLSAERRVIRFMNKHDLKNDVVLHGNTIGFDRKFIKNYFPKIERRLHYRMLDVSAFKCLFIGKYGIEYKKKEAHRALEDVQESIDELKYYSSFIKTKNKEEI